jgi:hypothetical protein
MGRFPDELLSAAAGGVEHGPLPIIDQRNRPAEGELSRKTARWGAAAPK